MVEDPRSERTVRETVGVFHDTDALEAAVQDLLTEGFHQTDVSLLANEETVTEKLGRSYVDTRHAEDDPDAPRVGWVAPEARTEGRGALAGIMGYVGAVAAAGVTFATGGAAAIAVAAGILSGGALAGLGVALGKILDQRLAEKLHRQIARGGVIVWVRLQDAAREEAARRVLLRHGAEDVHTHELPSP